MYCFTEPYYTVLGFSSEESALLQESSLQPPLCRGERLISQNPMQGHKKIGRRSFAIFKRTILYSCLIYHLHLLVNYIIGKNKCQQNVFIMNQDFLKCKNSKIKWKKTVKLTVFLVEVWRYSLCEDIHALRLTSKLVDLRTGYANSILLRE